MKKSEIIFAVIFVVVWVAAFFAPINYTFAPVEAETVETVADSTAAELVTLENLYTNIQRF